MTDDAELAGLDPFEALDREAARIEAGADALTGEAWSRPSRCEGWTVRDVLAHLLAGEAYHRACLDGRVSEFIQTLGQRGASDLHTANALQLEDLAGRSPDELLAEWRQSNQETRRRFRERGDGTIDTSVGDYPNRWQAFHVAAELATHADDMFLPETPDDHEWRRAWRVPFSRFSLEEAKPELSVRAEGGRTVVEGDDTRVEVDDDVLVEAVAGRLGPSAPLDAESRALLSTMP